MKKNCLLSLLILILTACLLVLCGCEDTAELNAPTGLAIEDVDLTLSWRGPKGARLYTVEITSDGGEPELVVTSRENCPLESLDPGSYSVRVMAHGKDGESADSAWSAPITFNREVEPGMQFTLINGKTEYAVSGKGSAKGNIVIPDTYRNKPVTAVADNAFLNKNDVTGITLGKNVRSIGALAFANCSYLTEVDLGEGLVSIGENAFTSCRLLSGDLVIPSGVVAISAGAFSYCGSVESLLLPEGLQVIGENAFTGCNSLTSLTLPDSLVYVGDYAFGQCEGLTEIDFGSGIVEIGPYAFSALPITSVTLPDSVVAIGECAFINCSSLADVTLGDGVESIGIAAFANTAIWGLGTENEVYVGDWFIGLKNTSATVLNMRDGTVGIADSAFYYNEKLTDIILPDSLRIIGNRAFVGCSANNIVIGAGVERVGNEAFAYCKSLFNVILGSYSFTTGKMTDSSLITVGDNAFTGCTKLEAIVIPETVISIGSYAFAESGIELLSTDGLVYADKWLVGYTDAFEGYATVRPGTVGVANYAFYDCRDLKEVSLPSSLSFLGRGAFYNCRRLTKVNMPSSLEVINDYTFYHCDRYKVTSLPARLKSIGRSAFYKCGSRLSAAEMGEEGESAYDILVIPSGVEFIGDYAFYGCGEAVKNDSGIVTGYYGVDIIDIPGSVEHIGAYAFYKFASLKEITLGNGVRSIGERAFYSCGRLSTVRFGTSLESIGEKAFYKCLSLETITLPDTLRTIGRYAFYKCESLSYANLGEGVELIGDYAFSGCITLEHVRLCYSLTSIGTQAFRNCTALTDAVLHSGIQEVGKHAFYGCSSLTLYSDRDSASADWDKYWNSSYRPVVYSCTLSEEMDYVISIQRRENSLVNKNQSNTLSAPSRDGYTFQGFSTSSSATSATYTVEDLENIPEGRRFYAIWKEHTPEN